MSTSLRVFPDLRDVTVCAVDTINPTLAARALEISMEQCKFGDSLLLTHEPVQTRARVEKIDRITSLEQYSAFMLKQLVGYITTPWVLVVQWDGYVVDASQWCDAFFDFDYIGARWPSEADGADVGNGGFSLRSRKLLEALADARFVVPANACEDMLIGKTWRPALESNHGIRFAPAALADRFSYETPDFDKPTFGFHGPFNMWRYVDEPAMIRILNDLSIKTLAGLGGLSALYVYYRHGKILLAKAIYDRFRQNWSADEIVTALVKAGVPHSAAQGCISRCGSV